MIEREGRHRLLEIARHEPLHAVSVEADQLAQDADRQQVLAFLLLLHDDLRQHGSGDLVAALGVEHHEFATTLHHLAQVVERDIAAG